MVIKVIGFDKCIKKLGDISGIDLTPEIIQATRKVQKTAKELSPKKSGTLRNSIHTKILNRKQTNVTGVVYTNTEYAIYQEFGTRFQPGKAFMRPSMDRERAGVNSSMQKYIKEQLKIKANGGT